MYDYRKGQSGCLRDAEIASFDGARDVSNFQTFFPEAKHIIFPHPLFVSHIAISNRIAPLISGSQCCTKLCVRCNSTLVSLGYYRRKSFTDRTRLQGVLDLGLQFFFHHRLQVLLRYLALVAWMSEQQFRIVEYKRSSRIQPGAKT